jgi:hypothetical protein
LNEGDTSARRYFTASFIHKILKSILIKGLFKPPVNWIEGKQGKTHLQAQLRWQRAFEGRTNARSKSMPYPHNQTLTVGFGISPNLLVLQT